MPGSWRPRLLIALALAAAVLPSAAGMATASRAATVHGAVWAYEAAHPGQPVPVIVQTAGDADAGALVTAAGGDVRGDLGIIHAVAADVPADRLAALASASSVRWISLDGPVTSTSRPDGRDKGDDNGNTDSPDAGANLPPSVFTQEINAAGVVAGGQNGTGVAVAVVDTGIVRSADFGRPSRVAATFGGPGDGYGHGSHVAGLIAGDGTNSNGRYAGVAPGASLVDVKVGDDTGAATISDVINGLAFVLANQDRLNIRVVNLSLSVGTPQSYTTDPLDAAVELLTFRGILVVVAAGNAGTASDAVTYAPANDPFVLTVGAVDDQGTATTADDTVPAWSGRGTTQDGFAKPEIYAPGRHLVSVLSPNSVLATQQPEGLVGKHYFSLSGTSMAAGVTSGAAALVFGAHGDWTPGQVKTALVSGAQPVPSATYAQLARVDAAIAQAAPADLTPTITPNYLLLQAVGVINADTTDWNSIRWGSIRWGSIRWGSIRWGSIRWGSIRWGSIRWGSIRWGFVPD